MCKAVEMIETSIMSAIDKRLARMPSPSIEDCFSNLHESLDRYIDKARTLEALSRGVAKSGEPLDDGACWGLAEFFNDIYNQFNDILAIVGVLEGKVKKKASGDTGESETPEAKE